jgi:hypothetical protein
MSTENRQLHRLQARLNLAGTKLDAIEEVPCGAVRISFFTTHIYHGQFVGWQSKKPGGASGKMMICFLTEGRRDRFPAERGSASRSRLRYNPAVLNFHGSTAATALLNGRGRLSILKSPARAKAAWRFASRRSPRRARFTGVVVCNSGAPVIHFRERSPTRPTL